MSWISPMSTGSLWSLAVPESHRVPISIRRLIFASLVKPNISSAISLRPGKRAREGQFEAEKFQTDVTRSPIPRFDLLKFDDYLHIGVQFSRGCPFTWEFCDILELYGRVPRAKTNAQMLAELDELYRLGYRGHVDFVDDNLIGNKKAVKAFLPELATWLDAHEGPFEFTTEASINIADDAELLRLLNRANFVGVFVGIESPDTATLVGMRKKR